MHTYEWISGMRRLDAGDVSHKLRLCGAQVANKIHRNSVAESLGAFDPVEMAAVIWGGNTMEGSFFLALKSGNTS